MFTSPQGFSINNSQLTNINNHPTGPSGIDILFEASIPEAAHDSSARDPPPRCFPSTRSEYIEDITNWALPAVGDTPLPLYWMRGPAGVGKSAVAQTCAENLRRQKKLGAAFFFSINRRSRTDDISVGGSRGEHYKFFTSIAYQLSTVYPNYRNLLNEKIRQDRSLIDKTMESQFLGLIVEPLRELEESGLGIGERIPVFVDGLDECESREAQCKIVEIVAAAARDDIVPLCWAFFSRPEPHIEATFSKFFISSLCHKNVLPISRDADGDIELYLRAGFEDVLKRLNVTMDSPWPSDGDIKELVRAAGGLFIYAKTVLRFVGQPDVLDPDELLRALIALISYRKQHNPLTESVFAELDAFYILIMKRIPSQMLTAIHLILTTLCAYPSYSSAIVIANLSGMSRIMLEAACNQLGAVLHFQRQRELLEFDPTIEINHRPFPQVLERLPLRAHAIIGSSLNGSISFHHKSFRDFLLDPCRSGTYSVNTPTTREQRFSWTRDIVVRFENSHRWQGLDLVREPGVLGLASRLSCPHANEAVNYFIETLVYSDTQVENTELGVDFDFRKRLYVSAMYFSVYFRGLDRGRRAMFTHCNGFGKCTHRTSLSWVEPDEFPKFDVDLLKEVVEERQRMNIIRPYSATSSFFNQSRDRVESGLYILGYGSKSIFWYWEINYNLRTYRDLETFDLAEGERLYREQFNLVGD